MYSRMWVKGLANERPSMLSITTWWESPMPSVKRPPQAAFAVRACCAIAVGWRGKVGTTPVPSSIRLVSRPASAQAMIASTPKMFANQADAKPSRSACRTCPTRSSIVAGLPAISPMPMPIFIFFMVAPRAAARVVSGVESGASRARPE